MNTRRIVFFGTPEFSVPTLEALAKSGYEIVAVVTQPDKPVGRGLKMEAPAVKVRAEKLGLKALQPDTLNAPTVIEIFKSLNVQIGVCVAYGKIIPRAVLDLFPHGVLNIHPSLLPKYRGPSPIQTAILNGDMETGVTIMLLDNKMDHGPILSCSVYRVAHNITSGQMAEALAQAGAKLLVKTLPDYLAGKITPQPQDHPKATFTKMITREDGRIDWNRPAEYLERLVRAYDMWPGTWTTYNNKRLKVLRASLLHSAIGCASNSAPGYVWKTDDGRFAVNCNPGSIILEQLQLEGKNAISGPAFAQGHLSLIGSVLN